MCTHSYTLAHLVNTYHRNPIVPFPYTYCNCWCEDKCVHYWNTNQLYSHCSHFQAHKQIEIHTHTHTRALESTHTATMPSLRESMCSLEAVSLLSPPPLSISLVTAVILSGPWQPWQIWQRILLTDTHHTHKYTSPQTQQPLHIQFSISQTIPANTENTELNPEH